MGRVGADADAEVSDAAVLETLERAQAWRALGRAFAPPRDVAQLRDDLVALRERARGPLEEALTAALHALAGAMPAELADVRGFLRAFGLEEQGELADHVATECELASVLALKEAWALGEGWEERAGIARDAYERLLGGHLLRWVPRFAACVRAANASAFHAAAASALTALLEDEARRLGLAPLAEDGPASLPSLPDEIVCGGGCPAACESPDA